MASFSELKSTVPLLSVGVSEGFKELDMSGARLRFASSGDIGNRKRSVRCRPLAISPIAISLFNHSAKITEPEKITKGFLLHI